MLVGAIDPMEGSLLVLPGSGLFALGTFLGRADRRVMAYRLWVLVLIAIGVGAMWGLTAVGGFGGSTGLSNWWGILILPYLIGWSMGVWGPESPRWMPWMGIAVSLWYVTILVMLLVRPHGGQGVSSTWPGIILGAVGVLTIGGCIHRLRKPTPSATGTDPSSA